MMKVGHDFTAVTGRDAYFAKLEEELRLLVDPATGKLRSDIASVIPCPNCGSGEYSPLWSKNGFDFVCCTRCKLVYTNPQVNRDVVLSLYKGASEADNMWTQVLQSPEQQTFNARYYGEVLDIVQTVLPSGHVLDIGCSVGTFMRHAIARGFAATGLELNEEAAALAEADGLKVLRQTIEEFNPATGQFQLMTLFGVLEHLNNPKEVLHTIYDALEPGGYLFLHVPNVNSLVTLVLQQRSKTFDGRNHLIYFSVDTLRSMAESVGFRVVYSDTCIAGVDQIVRTLRAGDGTVMLGGPLQALLADGPELEKLLKRYDLGYRIRMMFVK